MKALGVCRFVIRHLVEISRVSYTNQTQMWEESIIGINLLLIKSYEPAPSPRGDFRFELRSNKWRILFFVCRDHLPPKHSWPFCEVDLGCIYAHWSEHYFRIVFDVRLLGDVEAYDREIVLLKLATSHY
jgi:hypothetical protein